MKKKKRKKKEVEVKGKKKGVKGKVKRVLPPSPKGEIDFVKINRANRFNRVLIVLLIIIMGILLFTTVFSLIKPQKTIMVEQEAEYYYYYPEFISLGNSTYVSMYLPAVDPNGKGIIATLGVEASSGSGRVLVDIEDLVFWEDTQTSIRIAKNVASKITGKNTNDYNLVYNVYTNASMVGGPSAGAAIAIATIAALEAKELNENVMITGSVSSEGKIGSVSSVSAKAEAAKQINVTTMLVPPGQSIEVVYDINKKCEAFNGQDYCTIEQIPRIVNISEEVGINVVEVATVEEAMEYFF